VSPWLRDDIGYSLLTHIEIDQDDQGIDLYWEFDNDPQKGFYLILKTFPEDGLPHRYQIYRRSVLDVEGTADWSNILFGSDLIPPLLPRFFTGCLNVPPYMLLDSYSEAQWFRDDLPEDILNTNIMFSQLLSAQAIQVPPPTYKMRLLTVQDQRVIWEHTLMQSFLLYYITHSNHRDKYATPIIYFQGTRWVLDYDERFIAHNAGKFLNGQISGTPGLFIPTLLEQRTETIRNDDVYSDITAIAEMRPPLYEDILQLAHALYLKEDDQLGFQRSQVHIKTTSDPI
jgi:hypothetical protein